MEITKKLIPQWIDIEHAEEKLGFLCAPLTATQKLSVRALTESAETFGEGCMAAVRYATRDWRGPTKDGQPAPFSPSALEQFFTGPDLVPVLLDLSTEIIQRSSLSETERKN